jgi:REP element-mobilizing transposase RayT
MNRGIARRSMFERDADIRFFLSRVAKCVRLGLVEVHAYAILTTHFHMLVRSPVGRLADAMQRIQNEYSRWYNRRRKRDGTLVRGRFASKPVETELYRSTLVRYIDMNPIQARLVVRASDYRFGSAFHYARPDGPIWLTRNWVEARVAATAKTRRYEPATYPAVFGASLEPSDQRWIEHRTRSKPATEDPLDDLVASAPDRVRAWMERKARLADGRNSPPPCCDADRLDHLVMQARAQAESFKVVSGRTPVDGWVQVRVALFRDLAGLAFREAGARVGLAESGAWKNYARHRRMVREDAGYARHVVRLLQRVLPHLHSGLVPPAGPGEAIDRRSSPNASGGERRASVTRPASCADAPAYR